MNRVIIIGNGFDKAHQLPTGYTDFINHYWETVSYKIFRPYDRWMAEHYGQINMPDPYEDDLISFQVFREKGHGERLSFESRLADNAYADICEFINGINQDDTIQGSCSLKFKNQFLKHLSELYSLKNWVDIENEYYNKLKEILSTDSYTATDPVLKQTISKQMRRISSNTSAKQLNLEFEAIKNLLEQYLTGITASAQITKHPSIQEAFHSQVQLAEVACSKYQMLLESIMSHIVSLDRKDVISEDEKTDSKYLFCQSREDKIRHYIWKNMEDKNSNFTKTHFTPEKTLILNFNYTRTAEQLYADKNCEVIHIHGELNNPDNPIIFGYGDELDDDYRNIENLQDNEFLENIKSMRYFETGNYRAMLDFIESQPYQIFIMGHSCGNSDRTLLHKLFEHRNCFSIKAFYHQREDGTDDYSNLIRNISRNFNDKSEMRDIVVNKTLSSPLVPLVK